MQAVFWLILLVLLLLNSAAWAMVASYIAGLRDADRLDGFKDGLLLGPIGALMVLYRKPPIPDIEVECPHCGTVQDVGATLSWFECWHCEERTNLPQQSR